MRKLLWILLLAPCFAQTTNQFCPTNGNCVWTGTNTFQGNLTCTGAVTGCGGGSFTGLTNGAIQYGTSTSTTRAATYHDVVAIWTSCVSGWLKYDGTCGTPAGGATIASTTNVIKGDGVGNGVAASPGTDYIVPANLSAQCANVGIVNTTTLGSPNTLACINGVAGAGWVLTNNGVGVAPTYQAPTGGNGSVAYSLIGNVCQGAGPSSNGSYPAANAPTQQCIAGDTTGNGHPQSGQDVFLLTGIGAAPVQFVDQQFILPTPLTGTFKLYAASKFDTITTGTINLSFAYVCAAAGGTSGAAFSAVQNFTITVPGTINQFAMVAGTPTISGCSAGNVMYTRTGITGTAATGNALIPVATLFVQ